VSGNVRINSQDSVVTNNIITSCATSAGGSVSAQTVSIKCGPSVDEIKALVEQVTSNRDLAQLAENYRKAGARNADLISQIATKMYLRPEEVLDIIKSLSSELIIPGDAINQFSQVARQFMDTAIPIAAIQSSSPGGNSIVEQANAALQDGNIVGARRLLRDFAKPVTVTSGQTAKNEMGEGNDDLFGYGHGVITRTFSSGECDFWAHPCNIEINKIYAFRASQDVANDQPGFKFVVPNGVWRVRVRYQYVRGMLHNWRVVGTPEQAPKEDHCFPNFFWKAYYPDGSVYDLNQAEIMSCNVAYDISGRPSDSVPPIGYMVAIRQFSTPMDSSLPSGPPTMFYYGNQFVFAVTD
jgi:hypothetical protein